MTATGTAIAAIGKLAVDSYSNYEQLAGGVETLFGNSAKTIQGYADAAYQTAGMSANEYMDTVTSFSASLLQGLGGDTAAAAEIANQAVVDMSDNANKMGTDISMIQNAYQGFAKQNYTMLDNLKLGYGGTQAEMARLINDSGVLGDSMEVTAETVNEVSFDKIIEAIHTIQESMGIAGTTSEEAATTIQGSFSSVNGAWSNLLTAFAADGWDVGVYVDNLAQTLVTAGQNIIPRIQALLPNIANGITDLVNGLIPYVSSAVNTLLPSLIDGATSLLNAFTGVFPSLLTTAVNAIPQLLDAAVTIVSNLVGALVSAAPVLLSTGYSLLSNLVNGIVTGIPDMVARIPVVIQSFLDYITENMPAILQKGVELINSLVNGILSAIPGLVAALPQIITAWTGFLAENWPKIIESGFNIIVNLITGIMNAIPQIIASVPDLIGALAQGFMDGLETIKGIGKSAVQGIIDGISAAWDGLVSWFNSLWDGLFGNRKVNVDLGSSGSLVDGSHKNGLDYVPYNGYLAELHQGEMVLTRAEATDYRTKNDKAPTVINNITINGSAYSNPKQLAEVVAEEIGSMLSRKEHVFA